VPDHTHPHGGPRDRKVSYSGRLISHTGTETRARLLKIIWQTLNTMTRRRCYLGMMIGRLTGAGTVVARVYRDGHSYSRSAIENWFAQQAQSTCPCLPLGSG
jgi:predicted DNA-binding ribbon-helix-helix protein